METDQMIRRAKNFNVIVRESEYDIGMVDISITTNGFQHHTWSVTPGELATINDEIHKFLIKYVGE